MHLPLSAMDQMAEQDPESIRRFALFLMRTTGQLVRMVHDLQIPHAGRRIASVLHRAASAGTQLIPLSQSEIGVMANTSRKQVNVALKLFETNGWIESRYRSIRVLDDTALSSFAWEDE